MIAEGARRLADGERPRVGDMLLTPANVSRVADRLAHLRGAAMKLGQMISMDSGDILPAELTQILARLRSSAQHMPPAQLNAVLTREYGAGWRRRFARFEAGPVAAASIGQVHRALTHDGRELAVKVQYPGVADAIDADIDNVATLLRMSGLLPRELEIAPLLDEAKRQLAQEADYLREGAEMERFRLMLANSPQYIVPQLEPEFTTATVLAMSYLPGKPVESLVDAPQDVRNGVVEALLSLVLRELFEFGVMQTDPNFANYRWQPDSGRLVLLDFGATQAVAPATAAAYATLIAAAMAGERDSVREAALDIGLLGQQAVARHRETLDRMIDVVLAKFAAPGLFDFGDRAFIDALRPDGLAVAADKASWHLPPADLLFAQRKISGTALLAARLGARIDLRALLSRHLPAAQL
jgi:predicted unusual protein kinase regulating ubiquinone biosynthesis (AarF/ABC1/UbiB family)